MSVAVSRSDGVTVLTLTSDPSRACPPFCQLLGALCYSPALCSLRRRLTFQRGGAQSALGALWIITGIMHIGLGTVLLTNWRLRMYVLRDTSWAPEWLGGLFMFCGVCCVLAERYPRRIGVLLSGLLNVTGVALSITAIVLYSIQIGVVGFWDYCEIPYWKRPAPRRRYYDRFYDRNWTPPTTAPTTMPSDQVAILERCEEAKGLMRALTYSVLAVLITLSTLDLCLGLSSAMLSFKSLKQGSSKSGNKTKATTEK